MNEMQEDPAAKQILLHRLKKHTVLRGEGGGTKIDALFKYNKKGR